MSELHCETCGRRVDPARPLKRRGWVGALVVTDKKGNVSAWCPAHARKQSPWYGCAGWAWMREYDRLWEKAHANTRLEELRTGGREIVFDAPPPYVPGEVVNFTKKSWATVEWIREPSPGRYVMRVRRHMEEEALYLRTGTLPYTAESGTRASHSPNKDELEAARMESAYRVGTDALDAGGIPPGDVGKYKASVQAKARYEEVQSEVNSEAVAERQHRQLLRRIQRVLKDGNRYGVDLSPQMIGMLREAESAVGEARQDAA